MWVILIGVHTYNFILRPIFFFDWPLGPLQIALSGIMFVFYSEVMHVRAQFLVFWQKVNNINDSRWMFERFQRRIFSWVGFFIMGLGLILLISKPLRFPDLILSNIQQIFLAVFIAFILLGIICISWYLYLRDKRRA